MSGFDHIIPASAVKLGKVQVVTELHITGGFRARNTADGLWIWHPVLVDGALKLLKPKPINIIHNHAVSLGMELFGGNQVSGLGTPLISQIWTPLDGPNEGKPQSADTWNAISQRADRANDAKYSTLSRHIAFSLSAAGIRLRDASDNYHSQLLNCIQENTEDGSRFSNIPMRDLQLAFHSVLSELSSARDYLAAILAYKLGAPDRIDAMNRFVDWISVTSRNDLKNLPVVSNMISAYDQSSRDPWLHHLTEYRNLFLHRKPIGSSDATEHLTYVQIDRGTLVFPSIQLPLGENDPSAPGRDALTRFVELFRAMTKLVDFAASNAPYKADPLSFLVR